MTNKTGCREAFEREWPNWDKYPSGNYIDDIVQASWEQFQSGWQAAWNAATQPPTDAQKVELESRIKCIDRESYGDDVLFIPVHRITLDMLIKAALQSTAVPRELVTLMKDANDVLRSAYQISLRGGRTTNWSAFAVRVKNELNKQHEALALLGGREG